MTTKRIWLDSETRSRLDLKKVGLFNYTDACEPILITYAFDDEPVQVWQVDEPLPERLLSEIRNGVEVAAHNALFDYLALKDVLGLKLEQMADTMAISTANHLPASLDQQGKVLGAEQQKKAGWQLINHFCTPNKLGGFNAPSESPDKWQEFIDYAVRDVDAMRENTKKCRELSAYEQKVWVFTQRMNMRGVPINLNSAKHFKQLAKEVKAELNAKLEKLTGIKSASQTAKIKEWLHSQGFEVDGVAKDIVRELLSREDLPDIVREVLEIRQQASMTSTAKFDVFLDTANNGRIKGAYMYHGANTGRYASRGGLNLQNIPRGSEEDAVGAYNLIKTLPFDDYEFHYGARIDPLSSIIRPTIEAPAGKKFVDFDYSSIENRVAPWIGGELKHLDLFRNGLDEYKDFATQIYGVRYDDVTKEMRQISKSAILGSVFGAGARGLQAYYAQFGVEISLTEAEKLIRIYRNTHRGIVSAWYAFGREAMKAVKAKGRVFETNRCKLVCKNEFLRLKLPSGRVISWYAPRIEMVTAPWGAEIEAITIMKQARQGHNFVRQQLIGSSIFQSVVQATARDILVDAMMNLEKAGYELVMTTHDEVLAEVAEDWDDADEFERIMTTNPEWCQEIPLAVEGWVGKNYRK